jgi:hypothetical protein
MAFSKKTEPDAWMRLVLKSMSDGELRGKIEEASDEESDIKPEELRWFKEELLKRQRGGRS